MDRTPLQATHENISNVLCDAGFTRSNSSRKRYVTPGFDVYGGSPPWRVAYYAGSDQPHDAAESKAASIAYEAALAPHFVVERINDETIQVRERSAT